MGRVLETYSSDVEKPIDRNAYKEAIRWHYKAALKEKRSGR
jgi:hypothetical protein